MSTARVSKVNSATSVIKDFSTVKMIESAKSLILCVELLTSVLGHAQDAIPVIVSILALVHARCSSMTLTVNNSMVMELVNLVQLDTM